MYKIVKVYSIDTIYVIDLYDFCAILVCGYTQDKSLKLPLNNKISLINKRRDFSLFYKGNDIIKLPYIKCKLIMKKLKPFYFSYIMNHSNFEHIDNKKKELNIIMIHINKYVGTDVKMLLNEKMKKCTFNDFHFKCDSNIIKHLSIYYYLQK